MIKEVVVEHTACILGISVEMRLIQVHKWEVTGIGPDNDFYQRCPELDGHFLVNVDKVRLEGALEKMSWREPPENVPDGKRARMIWLIDHAFERVRNYLAMVEKFKPEQLDGLQMELF